MHTDQFDPDELRLHADEDWDAAPPRAVGGDGATQPVGDETQPVGDATQPVSDETQPVETDEKG